MIGLCYRWDCWEWAFGVLPKYRFRLENDQKIGRTDGGKHGYKNHIYLNVKQKSNLNKG